MSRGAESSGSLRALRELARLYGVQTAYYDTRGRRQTVSPGALLAVLMALGAPLKGLPEAASAVRERRRDLWTRALEPVLVAWDGRPLPVRLQLPAGLDGRLLCRLELEGGEARSVTCDLASLPVLERADVEGETFDARELRPAGGLPAGYHRLRVEIGHQGYESCLISAPRRAMNAAAGRRSWALSLPLYALHSAEGWGAGDFTLLHRFATWTASLGGALVGLLPLLAAFLDEPGVPSPYSPVSRRFWNELYVDPARAPELAASPEARNVLASPRFREVVEASRAGRLVDYAAPARARREVLAALADVSPGPQRGEELEKLAQALPGLDDYAGFRAARERFRRPWREWPAAARDGRLRPEDADPDARHYHRYVQCLAEEQLGRVAGDRQAAGLFLDLPLGVHPDGYDTWRERHSFAEGVHAGAPPDTFFSRGQDWGLAPLHPERMREDGHRYFIASIRHHLRHARLLRVDHIMGLHRLFWVPRGHEPADGVYVRYPAEELYAVLTLESHRSGGAVAGEDLGTVPGQVRSAMGRHGIYRTWVLQYELGPGGEGPSRPPRRSVAALNTHDMPPFAAFLEAGDVADRVAMGLLDEGGAASERQARADAVHALALFLHERGWLQRDDERGLLAACLRFLAAGPTAVTLVNLEDLWLERLPQNLPGTGPERPNWQRRARYGLESFSASGQVRELLAEVSALRRRRRGGETDGEG